MGHTQFSRPARRAQDKEHSRSAAQERPSVEDPQLRQMLATHIHCGQPMTLVTANPAPAVGGPVDKDDDGQLTYRCACGFSFDKLPG